jgi:hypothetical protein
MKKLILIILIVLSINASSQSTYISPYANYSNKVIYYGIEVGLSWSKVWISTDYSYTPIKKQHFIGVNLYNKLTKTGKFSYWLYNSLGYDFLAKTYIYEPGSSIVFDLSKAVSPQFTVSIPVVKSTHVSYSLSLMLNLN